MVSLTVLILIAAFFFNAYWSPILANKLKQEVAKSTNGLYKVDFSDAQLHVIEGRVVIYNLYFRPDTNVYNERRKLHLAPNNLFEVHVKRLVLQHIHPFKLFTKKELDITQIILNGPEVRASYQLNHTRDTVLKDNRTLWQRMSKSLKSVHVGRILLNNVSFQYQDYSGNKVERSAFKELNVTATDMLIDSATQADRSRLLYCRDIMAELSNYSGKTPNGLYHFNMNSLRLSTRDSKLTITGLDLTPLRPDAFFDRSKSDRFTLHLDSAILSDFDYLAYHKYRSLRASRLETNGGSLAVFSNYKGKPKNTDRVATFPNSGLAKIGIDLYIGKLKVKHIKVSYSELNKKSKKVGEITFNNTSGSLLNITNNPDSLKKNNICAINLTSRFMDQGDMWINVNFNLTDSARSFSYKGGLGVMDAQVLNKASMALGLLKINTGTIKSFDFNIKGDRYGSKGRIKLLYNNLKITVLKADTDQDVLKKKLLASLFANIMIIKHDNPDDDKTPPRFLDVDFKRPPEFPFFKTVWNTMFLGIKACAGVSQQVEQNAKQQMQQHDYNVAHRAERKAARQAKRAERKLKRALKKQQKEAEKQAGQL